MLLKYVYCYGYLKLNIIEINVKYVHFIIIQILILKPDVEYTSPGQYNNGVERY